MAVRREIPPLKSKGWFPTRVQRGLVSGTCWTEGQRFTIRSFALRWIVGIHIFSQCLIQSHRWKARYIAGTMCAGMSTISGSGMHVVHFQGDLLA
jgi:hypothetical protein